VRGGRGAIGASTFTWLALFSREKIIGVIYSWSKPLSIQRSNNIVNVDFVVAPSDRGRFAPRSDDSNKLFSKPRGDYSGHRI
jgi:hypothetical protein